MSSIRRWLVPSAAVLGLAALLGWFMFPRSGSLGEGPTGEARRPAGPVVPVEVRAVPRTETAVGTVRAGYETTLSARLTATVTRAPARDGDDVDAEQVLFELDARDLRAQLAQAEEALSAAVARRDDAERTATRIASLLDRGVVSVAERDEAASALDVARADVAGAQEAVREARTRVSYATIRAPFAARLVERFVDPGDTVMPGVPMARLYDPDRLRLEADVREALARLMRDVGAVTVRIDALDRVVEGRVEEIVPASDPGSRTFVAKVGLAADPALFPGMFGRLTIPLGTVERYLVPERAVYRVGQLEYVDAVVEGRLQRRLVRTGDRTPDGWIEVRSGLAPGESVALPAEATDGAAQAGAASGTRAVTRSRPFSASRAGTAGR
jgi:membrane fusion protein (multidrug efflux system)